eukprot:2454338-Amphidinium_carterae.2
MRLSKTQQHGYAHVGVEHKTKVVTARCCNACLAACSRIAALSDFNAHLSHAHTHSKKTSKRHMERRHISSALGSKCHMLTTNHEKTNSLTN